MSKPKCIKPSLELVGLLDTDYNTKEAFLKAFAISGDETESAIQTDISLMTLEKLKKSDVKFSEYIDTLSKYLKNAKTKRTKALAAYADNIRTTLKAQGIYNPLSELYISQYASVSYDLEQLESQRSSPYYEPTAKDNLEALVKARRSELAGLLKALIPTQAVKPKATQSIDPINAIL